MPWLYSVSSGTPPSYTYTIINYLNQHCSAVGGVPANASITQLKVYASGYSGTVATRLILWNDSGSREVLRQSSVFNMPSGSEIPGGQQWYTKSITPRKMAGGTYWVGLYRNPKGGHIAGTTATGGGTSYRKTNTAGFPSVTSMSGYSTHNKEFYVGLFYITAPDPVTSLSASWVTNSKINLSWTKHSTSDKPYTYQIIERYDNATNSYYRIAKISGSPSSYSDTTTKSNRFYRYRIKTYNESGYSSYAYSGYVNTTPAQPSNVVATRVGTTVKLTWNDNSTNEDQFRIQKRSSPDQGASWGSWGSDVTVTANEEEYIDSSPYTYGQYRIRSEETTQSLWYNYVESNEVITIAPPDAPTGLYPVGEFLDGNDAITFRWRHNSVDGTSQSKFSLRYKLLADSWPVTPQLDEVSSTLEYHEFAAETFDNNEIYYWQVKTWGQDPTESSWSDSEALYTVSRPVGTITSPNGIDDYGYSLLSLQWLYSQAQTVGQAQYIAKLYDENDVLLESKQAYSPVNDGGTGEAVFDYELQNATNYKCTLQVQDNNAGLWSYETEVEFTTDFYVPSTPVITVNNNSDGIVTIDIENPSPEGTELIADHNNLYRSIDGINYELVYENIEINTTITDYLPNIGGDTYYYVNAVSTTPSIAKSNVEQITQTLQGYYFLNGGTSYSTYLAIFGDILFSDTNQIDVTLKQFEGRTYPVKYIGDSIKRMITFAGDVLISDYATIKEITESENIFYRDYKGNYFKCHINTPQFDKKDIYAYQFKCVIERIEDDG
jgi:hypothetical protein